MLRFKRLNELKLHDGTRWKSKDAAYAKTACLDRGLKALGFILWGP